MIDSAWSKLSIIDFETHRAVKRATCDAYGVELTEGTGGRNGGLNAVMVDYHLFEKLVGHEKSGLYPLTLIGKSVIMQICEFFCEIEIDGNTEP